MDKTSSTRNAAQQIVGRERREREVIADFQLPIVDLIRAAASTPPLSAYLIGNTGDQYASNPYMNRWIRETSAALRDPRSIILGFAWFNFVLIWLMARHLGMNGIACGACPWYVPWNYLNEPTILLVSAMCLRVNRWWGRATAFVLASYLIGSFIYLFLRIKDPIGGLRDDWILIRRDYPYIVGSWDSQYLFALVILCCSIFYLARAVLRRSPLLSDAG